MSSRRSLPVVLWLLLVVAAFIAVELQPTANGAGTGTPSRAATPGAPSAVPGSGVALVPGGPGTAESTAGTTASASPTSKPTAKPAKPAATTKPRATPAPTARPNPTTQPTPKPNPTPAPTPKPAAPPGLSACPIFPSSNVWNKRVDTLPVASDSAAMVAAIGAGAHLHPDFSNGGNYGIPYNIVGTATARSSVSFQYASESDKVRYPIPASPKIEGGSDAHILMVDTNACKLYELYAASHSASGWHAGSGAVWDLRSNALRPNGWTSGDAAGLPIFPGLVRYDEVAAGVIDHALRFTAPSSCSGHIYPARHDAGSGSCNAKPPMGLRVRLKSSVDISGFGTQARVLLTALKRYGMILADNGSPWYVTGAPSSHWNDDVLHALNGIPGSDFEVVDTSGFTNGG